MPVTPPPADHPGCRLAPRGGEGVVAAALAAGVLLAALPAAVAAAPEGFSAAPVAFRLDANAATPAELAVLRGVGPVLAGRIADGRAARGAFRRPADLLAVKGVGPRTLVRLAPLLRFPAPARPAGNRVAAR